MIKMKLSYLIEVMEKSIRNSDEILHYLMRKKSMENDSESVRITDLVSRIEFKQILLELMRGVDSL